MSVPRRAFLPFYRILVSTGVRCACRCTAGKRCRRAGFQTQKWQFDTARLDFLFSVGLTISWAFSSPRFIARGSPSQLVCFQAALPSDAGGARPSPRVLVWKKGHEAAVRGPLCWRARQPLVFAAVGAAWTRGASLPWFRHGGRGRAAPWWQPVAFPAFSCAQVVPHPCPVPALVSPSPEPLVQIPQRWLRQRRRGGTWDGGTCGTALYVASTATRLLPAARLAGHMHRAAPG